MLRILYLPWLEPHGFRCPVLAFPFGHFFEHILSFSLSNVSLLLIFNLVRSFVLHCKWINKAKQQQQKIVKNMAFKTGVHVCIVAQRSTNKTLLYKHQWNTRWAFARKHDIFTRENNHMWKDHLTLGTRGFSRVRRECSVLAEGARVTIKIWQKPETALAKSLAPTVVFLRPSSNTELFMYRT